MAKAKKAATTGGSKKKSAPQASGIAPTIDTAQAAMAAANFIKAKAVIPTGDGPSKESASFKNLRDSVNKPASGGMNTFFDQNPAAGQKKSGAPQFGGKQVGRNQTFGADVNRAGVPRRTGGG